MLKPLTHLAAYVISHPVYAPILLQIILWSLWLFFIRARVSPHFQRLFVLFLVAMLVVFISGLIESSTRNVLTTGAGWPLRWYTFEACPEVCIPTFNLFSFLLNSLLAMLLLGVLIQIPSIFKK